jgi:hypothetical protein
MNTETQQHEKYLRGELSNEEVENLWSELITDPERYERFVTHTNLQKLFSSTSEKTSV